MTRRPMVAAIVLGSLFSAAAASAAVTSELGGPGANTLDLDALSQQAFPQLASVAALGNEGDDTIAGSPLSDEVDGGEEGHSPCADSCRR